jgi:hypothetical protein
LTIVVVHIKTPKPQNPKTPFTSINIGKYNENFKLYSIRYRLASCI